MNKTAYKFSFVVNKDKIFEVSFVDPTKEKIINALTFSKKVDEYSWDTKTKWSNIDFDTTQSLIDDLFTNHIDNTEGYCIIKDKYIVSLIKDLNE